MTVLHEPDDDGFVEPTFTRRPSQFVDDSLKIIVTQEWSHPVSGTR